jgi:predicted ArsR family transcriptional regulator
MRLYSDRPTIAERTKQLLTTDRPLTAAAIATRVGTTPAQARRALRLLESQHHAARHIAAGGRYEWTATDSSTKRTR